MIRARRFSELEKKIAAGQVLEYEDQEQPGTARGREGRACAQLFAN